MKSLQNFRREAGEFTFPEWDEKIAFVQRIDKKIQVVQQQIDTTSLKGLLTRTARLNLASEALTEAEGYTRKVHSYNELTRAELRYVEAWIDTLGTAKAMQEVGFKATGAPTPRHVVQIIKEGEVSDITGERLIERFIR